MYTKGIRLASFILFLARTQSSRNVHVSGNSDNSDNSDNGTTLANNGMAKPAKVQHQISACKQANGQ